MPSVVSGVFLEKINATLAGGATLKQPTHIAFGSGGHNLDNSLKTPSASATGLQTELLRKAITGISQADSRSVTATGRITESELVGQVISEVALFDADGTIMGIRTFGPRTKQAGETIEFPLTLRF